MLRDPRIDWLMAGMVGTLIYVGVMLAHTHAVASLSALAGKL